LIVFAVVGETGVRLLDVLDRLNATPRQLFMRTDVAHLPYRLRPSISVLQGETRVTINAHGLRGPELRTRSTQGETRILVLGDSVVFGTGVADDETFPAQLQRVLEERYQWRGEVLNGGAPGYNTAAEAAYLRLRGPELAPDRILLGVCFNDHGEPPVLNAAGIMTTDRRAQAPRWWERSELVFLLSWGWKSLRSEYWYQQRSADGDRESRGRFAGLDGIVERRQRRFYKKPGGEGWKRVRVALRTIQSWAQDRGIPFDVVLFPEAFQFGSPPFRKPQLAWLRLCRELGIPTIDLWPSFAGALRSDKVDLFLDAQHPNAAGLRLAAEVTASEISGSLGAPANARAQGRERRPPVSP
jgi:lysophospholipase L1-like esterase